MEVNPCTTLTHTLPQLHPHVRQGLLITLPKPNTSPNKRPSTWTNPSTRPRLCNAATQVAFVVSELQQALSPGEPLCPYFLQGWPATVVYWWGVSGLVDIFVSCHKHVPTCS